jgi:hypothetical protein
MANVEALRENMDRVIDASAQGTWNQCVWVVTPYEEQSICRTAGCFAGHYAFSQGYTQLTLAPAPAHYSRVEWVLKNPKTGDVLRIDDSYIQSSNTYSVCEFAKRGLGLTWREAESLFYASNSLETLKHKVDQICAGETPSSPYNED